MPETYATLTAKGAGTLLRARVELVGVPHKLSGISNFGADGDGATPNSVNPISICSAPFEAGGYTAAQKAGFVYTLTSLSFSGEQIDPVTFQTTLGSLSMSFLDFKVASGFTGWASSGSYLFADVFAAQKAARVTTLGATLTATAGTMSAADSLTQGTAYFLAQETIVAQGSGSPVAVVRGLTTTRDLAAKSLAVKHVKGTEAEPRADDLFDRPRTWWGREVLLFFSYDHADIDKADEYGPFRFRLSAYPEYRDGLWRLRADSYLGMAKKEVARGAWRARFRRLYRTPTLPDSPNINALLLSTSPTSREPAYNANGDRVWVDIGGEAVESTVLTSEPGATVLNLKLAERGRLGTRATEISEDTDLVELKEILPTDSGIQSPRIGYVPYSGGAYNLANLVASEHPVVAFLCMLLSRTGDLTNYETAGDRNYDVLPSPWGIAWPPDRVNLVSFEAFITETADFAAFPRFRLGHDGAFSLLGWWQAEVAPLLGVSLVMNSSGDLELVRVADVYALAESVDVDLSHIEEGYHGYAINDPRVTNRISVQYTASDGTLVTVNALSVFADEMYPDDTRKREWKSEGATERTRPILEDRAIATIIRDERPRPVADLELPWAFSAGAKRVSPGTVLVITDAAMPNIRSGGYGVTKDSWITMGTTYDLRLGGRTPRASVKVRALRASSVVKHFGPAARVISYDAGTATYTVAANDYTPTTAFGPYVTDKDVKAFGVDGTQNSRGLRVALYNSDLVRRDDNGPEIKTLGYAGNTIAIDIEHKVGGVPVTPVAGDILRLVPYNETIDGQVTAGSISANQDDYLAQAGSDRKIGTALDGHEWGA